MLVNIPYMEHLGNISYLDTSVPRLRVIPRHLIALQVWFNAVCCSTLRQTETYNMFFFCSKKHQKQMPLLDVVGWFRFPWNIMESSREMDISDRFCAAQGWWMAGMKMADAAWLHHGDGRSWTSLGLCSSWIGARWCPRVCQVGV